VQTGSSVPGFDLGSGVPPPWQRSAAHSTGAVGAVAAILQLPAGWIAFALSLPPAMSYAVTGWKPVRSDHSVPWRGEGFHHGRWRLAALQVRPAEEDFASAASQVSHSRALRADLHSARPACFLWHVAPQLS
jgi:hypothetical protein